MTRGLNLWIRLREGLPLIIIYGATMRHDKDNQTFARSRLHGAWQHAVVAQEISRRTTDFLLDLRATNLQ